MINILFVCHGNICRSPMAEFMFRQYVQQQGFGDKFHVASAATSYEEIGNPVYPPARKMLNSMGIDCTGKVAKHFDKPDYKKYDYIICMDNNNLRNLLKTIKKDPENKVSKILDYTSRGGEVADPW